MSTSELRSLATLSGPSMAYLCVTPEARWSRMNGIQHLTRNQHVGQTVPARARRSTGGCHCRRGWDWSGEQLLLLQLSGRISPGQPDPHDRGHPEPTTGEPVPHDRGHTEPSTAPEHDSHPAVRAPCALWEQQPTSGSSASKTSKPEHQGAGLITAPAIVSRDSGFKPKTCRSVVTGRDGERNNQHSQSARPRARRSR